MAILPVNVPWTAIYQETLRGRDIGGRIESKLNTAMKLEHEFKCIYIVLVLHLSMYLFI